jgi:hypothetical protein
MDKNTEQVIAHQNRDRMAGHKWICNCNICQAERRKQRRQDVRCVPCVDYIKGT